MRHRGNDKWGRKPIGSHLAWLACKLVWCVDRLALYPGRREKHRKTSQKKRECQGTFGDLKVHFLLFGWTQFQFGGGRLERETVALYLWEAERGTRFSFTYLKIDIFEPQTTSKVRMPIYVLRLQVNLIHNKIIFSKHLSLCRSMYSLLLPIMKDRYSIFPCSLFCVVFFSLKFK